MLAQLTALFLSFLLGDHAHTLAALGRNLVPEVLLPVQQTVVLLARPSQSPGHALHATAQRIVFCLNSRPGSPLRVPKLVVLALRRAREV